MEKNYKLLVMKSVILFVCFVFVFSSQTKCSPSTACSFSPKQLKIMRSIEALLKAQSLCLAMESSSSAVSFPDFHMRQSTGRDPLQSRHVEKNMVPDFQPQNPPNVGAKISVSSRAFQWWMWWGGWSTLLPVCGPVLCRKSSNIVCFILRKNQVSCF